MSTITGEPKPATLTPRVENVPDELTRIHGWVGWCWERREGKWTKPPRMVDGRPASSTDPATWAPFEDVYAVYDSGMLDGVGFALDPALGFVGFDLDHVIDPAGTIHPEALRIADEINSYTERSPSGTGLRIITRGALPAGWRNARAALAFPIECYSEGRYLTITGHHLEGTPHTIEDRPSEVAALHSRVAALIGNGHLPVEVPVARATIPDDAKLLERARAARNGPKFSALWDGDTSAHGGDDSAADLALCSMLAFWTGRDTPRIDRLFRQSGLMRPKWDKARGATQTYGGRTITKANEECGEVYSVADLATPNAHRSALPSSADLRPYLEPIAVFLAEEDPPDRWIFPDLLHTEVLMLIHGEPRARKSLVGFELALSAATGTAPFGLDRFQPEAAVVVWYIQEEDARSLTRSRLRRLVHERCGASSIPETLHVSVRRGIDLDDPVWVARIIADAKRLGVRFLVLDAARRLSVKTDEGPAKVRELIAALRAIVTEAGVTIAIVHHDVKPSANGQDVRRRSQRASGGDWFAACECPVHVERVNEVESLVFPQDYKFSADPAPFTFKCVMDGRLIKALVGMGTTSESAETAGARGKLLAWLETNGPASKTTMKKAGFGWESLTGLLDGLVHAERVEILPGRKAGSSLYLVRAEPSSLNQDGTPHGADDAL